MIFNAVAVQKVIGREKMPDADEDSGENILINNSYVVPPSVGNRENEPWLAEEEQVQEEFREMMETEVTAQDGKFFQNDTDKTAEFLIWLKNKLDSRDVHRIILIDPYIEEESILKFVCCVGNMGIAYEIYTDSYAGKQEKCKKDPGNP